MLITVPQETKLDRKGTLAKSIRGVDERRFKAGPGSGAFGSLILTSLRELQCDVMVTSSSAGPDL